MEALRKRSGGIKVLIVNGDPYGNTNPYVRTIILGVKLACPDAVIHCNVENFWSERAFEYHLIHFMWPTTPIHDGIHHLSDLEPRLRELKRKGVLLAATCHNLVPHYSQNADNNLSYRLVYQSCDQIYHLGCYSRTLFQKEYPDADHAILFHHVYDEEYTFTCSKADAMRKLGLDENKQYVLCMGAFRDREERELLISLSKKLKRRNIYFLAPSFSPLRLSDNPFKTSFCRARFMLNKRHKGILFGKSGFISNDLLPYYYLAADICFIQRLKILNSGNLPMAFFFGKAVCGPNAGNVGEILKDTGNTTFDVSEPETAYQGILETFSNNEGGGRTH